MRAFVFALVCVLVVLPAASACSLCGSLLRRESLSVEFAEATWVLYGTVANPKLSTEGGPLAGNGTTEFHIEKVLKAETPIGDRKMLLLPRYVPILDTKTPTRFIVFFRKGRDQVEFSLGRQLSSPVVFEYLQGIQKQRGKDPIPALAFAAQHLDHDDPSIAEEAFLELARANDADIARLAETLSPDRLRKLLKQPNLEPERLSLFAYLLGSCGDASDAELFRSLLQRSDEKSVRSLEGVLAGYLTLRPKEGWQLTLDLLNQPKQPFLHRFAAVQTLRFLYATKSNEMRPAVVRAMGAVVANGETADLGIDDLRIWKAWDHTAAILASYGKPSHAAPIIRTSIERYAVSCPLPEARRFVDALRVQDAKRVRELEEELTLDPVK
jgi:hypothetical protein